MPVPSRAEGNDQRSWWEIGLCRYCNRTTVAGQRRVRTGLPPDPRPFIYEVAGGIIARSRCHYRPLLAVRKGFALLWARIIEIAPRMGDF